MNRKDSEACCGHHHGSVLEQTLEELEFEKSIYGCAVYGDLDRLKQIVNKKDAHSSATTTCLNAQDRHGYTCLHYAVRHSRLDICRYLVIEKRVDVNVKTRSCLSTPLHRACYVGSPQLVELLISHGARPLERDCDAKTPLHKCAEELVRSTTSQTKQTELRQCARILVKTSGSEIIYLKDASGKTPVDICPDLKELVN